ncbi:MAG: accessory gene regulator B family protein [Oscillospiraceae bacterium]
MTVIAYISDKILKFICSNSTIDDEMRDVYHYGIEITLSSILNFALIIVASLLLKDFLSGITFLLCFIPLRLYCGGYHAGTYFKCNTIFLLTYIVVHFASIFLSDFFQAHIVIAVVVLLAGFLPILFFSPVKNSHKKLSEKTAKKSRVLSIIIYILIALISLYLCGSGLIYGSILVITLTAVSVMILVEIFLQRRGYHEV